MPFLTLEYSANLTNLDAPALLLHLNESLVTSAPTEEMAIKSRASRFDVFQVGTTAEPRAFLHVKLSLLSGRTPEVKRGIAEGLMAVLQAAGPWPAGMLVQMAVELTDIDRAAFASARVTG